MRSNMNNMEVTVKLLSGTSYDHGVPVHRLDLCSLAAHIGVLTKGELR